MKNFLPQKFIISLDKADKYGEIEKLRQGGTKWVLCYHACGKCGARK